MVGLEVEQGVVGGGRPWSSASYPWWTEGESGSRRVWRGEGGIRDGKEGRPSAPGIREAESKAEVTAMESLNSCMVATRSPRVLPLRHSTKHVSGNDVVSVGSRFEPDLDRIWI